MRGGWKKKDGDDVVIYTLKSKKVYFVIPRLLILGAPHLLA